MQRTADHLRDDVVGRPRGAGMWASAERRRLAKTGSERGAGCWTAEGAVTVEELQANLDLYGQGQ